MSCVPLGHRPCTDLTRHVTEAGRKSLFESNFHSEEFSLCTHGLVFAPMVFLGESQQNHWHFIHPSIPSFTFILSFFNSSIGIQWFHLWFIHPFFLEFIYSVMQSFHCSFIHPSFFLIHPFWNPVISSFTQPSFFSLNNLFCHPVSPSLIHSSFLSLIHSYIHLVLHSFLFRFFCFHFTPLVLSTCVAAIQWRWPHLQSVSTACTLAHFAAINITRFVITARFIGSGARSLTAAFFPQSRPEGGNWP